MIRQSLRMVCDQDVAIRAPNLEVRRELTDFADWLIVHSEVDGLTTRRLLTLYAEWIDVTGYPALSEGQFFRRCKGDGIIRYRESIGRRRWLYRVQLREADAYQIGCSQSKRMAP